MAITGGYYNDWIFVAALLILLSQFIFDIWDIVCAVENPIQNSFLKED